MGSSSKVENGRSDEDVGGPEKGYSLEKFFDKTGTVWETTYTVPEG